MEDWAEALGGVKKKTQYSQYSQWRICRGSGNVRKQGRVKAMLHKIQAGAEGQGGPRSFRAEERGRGELGRESGAKREVPEWRRRAAAGLSLAAAARLGGTLREMPGGLSRDLSRVLRPQAAYRWLLPQLAAITPQYIEMVLRGALAGNHVQAWELFDLMEDSSPRLLKDLNELKRAVVAMDWVLAPWQEEDEPPSESGRERARLVSSALRQMRPEPTADENDFSGTIYDVLDAWGKGQTVLEVDWAVRRCGELGEIVAPRASYWVHPTCYAWTMGGRLGLRLELMGNREGHGRGRTGREGYKLSPGVWQSTTLQPLPSAVGEFPADKFLVSICKAKSGTALGGALLRPLAWWWCAGNFSADWLLNLAQVFGLPFRWANYDPAAPQGTVDAICTMLERMGSNAWAAFPAGTTLELKEAAKSGEHSPQGDMLDRAERQMDLLILGQTLTTDVSDGGGSRALGEVHEGVRGEVVQAAGNFSAGVINTQLIPSILRLNYGDDLEAPAFRPVVKKQQDASANAERDAVLLSAGLRMPKRWLYRRHDIPLPEAGEETIGGGGGGARGAVGGGQERSGGGGADRNDRAPGPVKGKEGLGLGVGVGGKTGAEQASGEFGRPAPGEFEEAGGRDLEAVNQRRERVLEAER